MKIQYLHIQNFKSIQDMEICDIENVLILVGKNNTGKTVILDAIRTLSGSLPILDSFFSQDNKNIIIETRIQFFEEDYRSLHSQGAISKYKRYDLWKKEFLLRLPSLQNDVLTFTFIANANGQIRYSDGYRKHNPHLPLVLPPVYDINTDRDFQKIQDELILRQDDAFMYGLRNDKCLFDQTRPCSRCFQCVGKFSKKPAGTLNILESARLFEYNLYQLNFNRFLEKVNLCFDKNGGHGQELQYSMNFNPSEICRVNGFLHHPKRNSLTQMETMSKGMRCIYILSLLEAYVSDSAHIPFILLMEDPEIFLHPELQKIAGNILFGLSKKNQVIFSTHSPNMLFNFTSGQIRQIALDSEGYTISKSGVLIDTILNDLGYTANDLMNVNFVFIVEGKQDKSRLPLLLSKYYSEVFDSSGKPIRIAIITTNSCTNIKTYANLKYINQLYLKDQFLMIRDGDGKNPEDLSKDLCRYYEERNHVDIDKLPRVTSKNVLILRYYSFENYFLNPILMEQIGILKKAKDFYTIFLEKWKEYLYKTKSGIAFTEKTQVDLQSEEDVRLHMDEIKIYLRGHNLFDLFYGPFRSSEQELLQKYIALAPREEFADILNAIDRFVYFENRQKKK